MRSGNSAHYIAVAAVLAIATITAASEEPAILTSPVGLVSGELDVKVDLGGTEAPAALYLDGSQVCEPSTAVPSCRVDLGADLHVHLLELIVNPPDGTVQKVERWINRPGYEADLEIEFASRPIGTVCGGRLNWVDVYGQQPAVLEVEAAGEHTVVLSENRTFGYPCAAVGETEVVAGAAIFPDGRRASSVALTGDIGKPVGTAPQPVVLEDSAAGGSPCAAVEVKPGRLAEAADWLGFEVAFVLDPSVDFAALAGLGTGGDTAGEPGSAWDRATAAFSEADRMWYVRPDSSLLRLDGFSESRDTWLGTFFKIGSTAVRSELRLSDAVATAGLVAGAAPRRRAVVLVLGKGPAQDTSRYSAEQTKAYLEEIGVPLVVIRAPGADGGGWPPGFEATTFDELANALESVRNRIDHQCVEWFAADLRWQQIVGLLPDGIAMAGGVADAAAQPVWRRAVLSSAAPDVQPISDEPVARGKVEVTAVEVLVRAFDDDGRPVTDMGAGDLRVTEDGNSVPVLGVEPLLPLEQTQPPKHRTEPAAPAAAPTRKIVPVSIYVEGRLAGTADIDPALNALKEQVDWLTSLGPVTIAVADRTVDTVLEGGTDPVAVRDALDAIASHHFLGHSIERIRADYVRSIREYPERQTTQNEADDLQSGGTASSTPDNALRVKTMNAARTSVFEEDALLRRTMERINDWALGLPGSGPRLLFLVGTGFDEDPIDFYLRFIELKDPSLGPAARAEFLRYNQATRVESVGRELAAAGWMVVPIATRIAGSQRTNAEFSGGETFQAFLTDLGADQAYVRDVEFMLLDPLGAQQHLAGPSGGEVVVGGKGLKKLVSESSGWYRLTYQVARAPDGALHDVAVVSERPDVEVENTGVVVSGTSEGRAEMRSRELLDDPSTAGDLSVRLEVGPTRTTDGNHVEASVIASVDLTPIAPLFTDGASRALRFSFAVRTGNEVPFVYHEVVTATGAVGGMQYETPLQWSGDDAELGVVVEDLGSGAWGGAVSKLGG